MSTYQSHARLRWALENITLSHNTMVRVFIIKHECVISTAVATVLPVSTGYHVHRLLPKHECIVYEIGREVLPACVLELLAVAATTSIFCPN